MLCMVLWKAEKHETQCLLFRSVHVKKSTEKLKEQDQPCSSVTPVCPWKTYLENSEEGVCHFELGATAKIFL